MDATPTARPVCATPDLIQIVVRCTIARKMAVGRLLARGIRWTFLAAT